MSQKIEIYTTTYCPFCIRAKSLLEEKKLSYQEFNLDKQPKRRDEMLARSEGRQTVPQIFINDKHIGGCDDIYSLNQSGKLDKILSDKPAE